MLVLPGSHAFSDFRLRQVLSQLRETVDSVGGVDAVFVYFLTTDRSLSPLEKKHLQTLLSEAGQPPVEIPEGEQFLITPRPGTISPWSSKASDILHNAGLGAVERIERGRMISLRCNQPLTNGERGLLADLLHDRMTEAVFESVDDAVVLFNEEPPRPFATIDISVDAITALQKANAELGLALSDDEIQYLADNYDELGRNPTDVELMMFAQANSEHCRHKIFNADWVVDDEIRTETLFGMIRNTYNCSPEGILSAYKDNASVVEGPEAFHFVPDPETKTYQHSEAPMHMLMKVETHNHPTAISPFPGAATGSGGEIRDEGATGSGSKPKAGLCGFSVSNLKIPGFEQPWETDHGKPERIVSALDIMIEGPIGAAAFNNEFGRPGLTGYFRTFEEKIETPDGEELRGYHKPIMVAGGLGSIRSEHIEKNPLPEGTPIIVLGGPAMLIGLGGGAASSMTSGSSCEQLDFASVQRGNPEIERRCQEVINRCTELGEQSPILSIHDVGAGGLSNAVPEIIHDAGRGGQFELRVIPSTEPGMSPMEIWCNEAQERYVLAIAADRLDEFEALAKRERCPYAVIGRATFDEDLLLVDAHFENTPVELPMDVLFGKPPKMLREVRSRKFSNAAFNTEKVELKEAVERVLSMPAVASKQFLITIGDRSVTGLVARDQMVGPWQVPVADVAVTMDDYKGYSGQAMAMGERTPLALINPAASGRMAIAEAITNIAATRIGMLSDIRLSANWMAAAGHPGEDAALFETVQAVGKELCPQLGIAIPVGKDSLSMKSVWEEEGEQRSVTAPLSLLVTAFAPVLDVRKTLTPLLKTDAEDGRLILIDLGSGKKRLGGSALAQSYKQIGSQAPDLDDPEMLKSFFQTMQILNQEGQILAYHDRSDGGLLATLCEMMFASHCGLDVQLETLGDDIIRSLFCEELGAVIQVDEKHIESVMGAWEKAGLGEHTHIIGKLTDDDRLTLQKGRQVSYSASRVKLQKIWSATSYQIQALRDNAECAKQEYDAIENDNHTGIKPHIGFDLQENVAEKFMRLTEKPAVAILREQGVNGHVEMAAAFDKAGFSAVDVHMTDILEGREDLSRFAGLVACGGFSYGDVLGAGGGWAKSILFNDRARDVFEAFFHRDDVFGLGVCNGCQMMSQLKELIPGAEHWPYFRRNLSEQFEARFSTVEVLPSPSLFLQEMQGSHIPIAVAHGEGRAVFVENTPDAVTNAGLVSMRFVDHHGHATEHYPENPNGSPQGITGLTTADGRFTIMMPHPERVFRTVQNSWHPADWGEDGPWLRMFRNARVWVG